MDDGQRWLKRVWVPFWAIQLVFSALLLVPLSIALAVVSHHHHDDDNDDEHDRIPDDGPVLPGDRHELSRAAGTAAVVAGVYIALCTVTVLGNVVEIVLLARKRLSATMAVTLESILTLIWVVVFAVWIVGAARGRSSLGFIFLIIILGSSIAKLIYSSVILHRFRTNGRFAIRGTYSSPTAHAEAGLAGGADSWGGAPLNPFRSHSRDASPANSIANDGSRGRMYEMRPTDAVK